MSIFNLVAVSFLFCFKALIALIRNTWTNFRTVKTIVPQILNLFFMTNVDIYSVKMKMNFKQQQLHFFFYLGFISQTFTNYRTPGEGGGHFLLLLTTTSTHFKDTLTLARRLLQRRFRISKWNSQRISWKSSVNCSWW